MAFFQVTKNGKDFDVTCNRFYRSIYTSDAADQVKLWRMLALQHNVKPTAFPTADC